jgi:eukaryotic-like serine/threonine-protein kinase
VTTLHGDLLAGRWRLGERIGRGAVADVFGAVDDEGRHAAVKILRHADEGQRARFEREVTALETLEHPNIVRVLDHGALDDRPYVVLERVDGGSLAELVVNGPLPPDRAAAIGAALADALDHAHRCGIVHRDVKPSNVLLDVDGTPKLADFGVAQLDGSGALTASGFTVGTAAYLAPEQVRGEPIGPAADVYSLGLLVLEAATGERAFDGHGVTAAMARLERPPEIPTTLPPALAGRIRAMTAMDPAERPTPASLVRDLGLVAGTALDEGTAVLPVVDDPTVVVPAPAAAPRAVAPIAPVRPFPWRSATAAAACFLLGFLLVLAVRADRGISTGDEIVDTDPVVVTSTTVAPATTAPPTTAPPTTAPPPPVVHDDEDEGRGNGNGNGRGRGDD